MKKLIFIYASILFSACNQSNHQEINLKNVKDDTVNVGDKRGMIMLTDRPYNLETPLKYFKEDYTPNEVFFVRWHLSDMPAVINSDTFRLRVQGHVKNELSLSLIDLRSKFKPVTIPALAVCAGNARSFFDPRVPGGQWKNGAMGNALWKGVRLKDVLDLAGVKPNALDVAFNGMDQPPLPSVPDFVKSLGIDHVMNEDVIIAYEMNGKSLPILNGYPLKLIVPGWYATYWIGMLNEIKVYPDSFKGYWMNKAYLIPKNVRNANESPDSLAKETVPISKLDIRSIFVSPEPDSTIIVNQQCVIEGLVFDGGDSIVKVEISTNGKTWNNATLCSYLGKYAWRRWKYNFIPHNAGTFTFYVKATNAIGETQPFKQWNRSGYMRNQIETLQIKAK